MEWLLYCNAIRVLARFMKKKTEKQGNRNENIVYRILQSVRTLTAEIISDVENAQNRSETHWFGKKITETCFCEHNASGTFRREYYLICTFELGQRTHSTPPSWHLFRMRIILLGLTHFMGLCSERLIIKR